MDIFELRNNSEIVNKCNKLLGEITSKYEWFSNEYLKMKNEEITFDELRKNIHKKLMELNNKKQEIINNALEDGYIFDDKNNIFLEKDRQSYFIHILINTIGEGESLGHFEIYDKVFPISKEFAEKSVTIDNLDDFGDKVLFSKVWDKDFEECTVFEDVYSSDWFCCTTKDSCYNNYENIITFRFSYIQSTMGNITIMKCNPSILKTHKNIYHYTKNYVLE